MNNDGTHTISSVGKLVTAKEAKIITDFIIEDYPKDDQKELLLKVGTCLKYMQVARLNKNGVWRANMMLRGKLPNFIKAKSLRKKSYVLDWSHIEDNKVSKK